MIKDYVSSLFFVVVTVVLLLTVLWYYFFVRVIKTTQQQSLQVSTDATRVHRINDLATKLSFLVSKKNVVLEFPTEWQQLGTATDDCQLQTTHCQIGEDKCFNLEDIIAGKFVIPVDSSNGSESRSGFAIKREGDVLHIMGCYTEATTPITQKINIR